MKCFYLLISPTMMWGNRILYSYHFLPQLSSDNLLQYFSYTDGKEFGPQFRSWYWTTQGSSLDFHRNPSLLLESGSGRYCAENENGFKHAFEYIIHQARLESSQVEVRDTLDLIYNLCFIELSKVMKGSILSFSMIKKGVVPNCKVKHLMRYIMMRESLIVQSLSECKGRTDSVCFVADIPLAAADILDSYEPLAMAKINQANTYLVSIARQLQIIISSGSDNEYFIFARDRHQSDTDIFHYLAMNDFNEDSADLPDLKLASFKIFFHS
ncbi:unnamed protein product [Blumeria hordei]|uniref:Uncharacterized protein n=1 Tax=Blumeria hordei TaxID=2867405 RepID=A0A383UIX4_BLUHO|nr:unnamed protein product [Blumeria hordei]